MSDAIDFLERLYPGGPWCLSAATPERDKLDTRTFSDPALARDWVEAWNGNRNLYFHVNPPRDKNARNKLKRTDVAAVHYLHVDIDPPDGQASDKEFRDRTLGLLLQAKLTPTIIINSGNGIGAFWLLTSPIELDGSVSAADDAGLYNRHLAESYANGDKCHNVDRLMRLPGTWNIPGESKRKKGITERRLSELLVFDASKTYDISNFKKAVAEGDSQTSLLEEYEIGTPVKLGDLTELEKWHVPTRVQLLCAKGSDPQNPKRGDNSRSAWLYDCICQLIRFGVPDEVILGIILDPEWKISESVLEKASPGPEAYARRQIEKAKRSAKRGEHSPAAKAAAPSTTSSAARTTVPHDFVRDQSGTPYPTQANFQLACQMIGVSLRKNMFSCRSIIEGLSGFGPHLDDDSIRRLRLLFVSEYKLKINKEEFRDFVEDQCLYNRFHPVLDYLQSVEWDGTPRLDTWLIRHAGVTDSAYSRAVSRLLLVAAVRRVRHPGAAFDEMLVLISPEQGWGKSKSIKQLCPDPSWFSDDLPLSSDSRVVIERSSGKWIIEAAELKGLRKSEAESLKAFMSRTSDTARLAYGYLPSEVLRQFVMFGTTNSLRFLQDPTGNRRFWPLLLRKVMVPAAIASERDQLWAEATHYESRGDSIRMDPSLYDSATNAQKEHSLDDPLKDALQEVLGDFTGSITSNDLWEALQISVERRNGLAQARSQALSDLGWNRVSSNKPVYVKGGDETPLTVIIDAVTKKPRVVAAYDTNDTQREF